MVDRRFVVSEQSEDVSQIVVANGVVSFDGNGFFVVPFGLVIVFEGPVAAAHVAVGLEIVRVVHYCLYVLFDGLLILFLALFLFSLIKRLFSLFCVDVSAGWPGTSARQVFRLGS